MPDGTRYPAWLTGAGLLLGGQAAWALSQWIIVVLIVRLLGPVAAGQYAWATSIATPVFLLCSGGLRIIAAADSRREFPTGALWTFRTAAIALAVCISVAIGAVSLLGNSGEGTFGWMATLSAIVLLKAVDSASDLTYGFLQRVHQFAIVSCSLTLRAILGASIAMATMLAGGSLPLALFLMALSWSAILMAWDLPRSRLSDGLSRSDKPLRRLLARVWPLALMSGLNAVLVYVPIYFLAGGSAEATGIFAAVFYLALPLNLIGSAVGHAVTPKLSAASSKRDLLTTSASGCVVSAGPGLIAALLATIIGGPFLEAVYGGAFAQQGWLLTVLILAASVVNITTICGYAATAHGYTAQLPLLVLLGIGAAVAANLALLNVLSSDLQAVGLGLLVGAGVQAVGSVLYLGLVRPRPAAAEHAAIPS